MDHDDSQSLKLKMNSQEEEDETSFNSSDASLPALIFYLSHLLTIKLQSLSNSALVGSIIMGKVLSKSRHNLSELSQTFE